MTNKEPFVMMTYDNHAGNSAKCKRKPHSLILGNWSLHGSQTADSNLPSDCPHVSVENPLASPNAPFRQAWKLDVLL
jgi:hypothetical protein